MLDILAEIVQGLPQLKVTATGHTDALGTDAYNLRLAENRANSARNYLIQKGAPPDHITIATKGESLPIAINALPDGTDSPEGRSFNRRVEFTLTDYPAGRIIIKQPDIPDNLKLK
jgi:outer membrane protein OmpA-like peptidoglycan-associated protein